VSGETRLRVQVEYGQMKADFEGSVDEVFEATLRFLTQVCPNLEIVQNIAYTPDLVKISKELAGLLKVTGEGLIMSVHDLPASKMISLALLGAHAGDKLGKLSKDTLSSNDLAVVTGKARKTVMNEMPRLMDQGYVERTSEGEYLITTLGIKRTEEMIEEYKAGG
jgi:hypothetical protein